MSRKYLQAKLDAAMARLELLESAISEHHAQKADDRCVEDDDRLYAAAGFPPCDRRVGDKAAMLENCKRFIENRCESGGWKSYAELKAENATLQSELQDWRDSHRRIISEPCREDERHCTCVPSLRMEIADLHRRMKAWSEMDANRNKNQEYANRVAAEKMRELEAEINRLKGELLKAQGIEL